MNCSPATNPNPTYEIHYFPTSEKLNSHKSVPSHIEVHTLIPPPKNARNIIVLGCHNVFDTNIQEFVKQCSLWNTSGYEINVCSFVGKNTENYALLLNTFDNPLIQRVIKSLIIVFDRKHPKKGKGHVIQMLLLNENRRVTFVDDEPENLQNCHDYCIAAKRTMVTTSESDNDRITYIHYVEDPKTQQCPTPEYAQRIDNFADLVSSIYDK